MRGTFFSSGFKLTFEDLVQIEYFDGPGIFFKAGIPVSPGEPCFTILGKSDHLDLDRGALANHGFSLSQFDGLSFADFLGECLDIDEVELQLHGFFLIQQALCGMARNILNAEPFRQELGQLAVGEHCHNEQERTFSFITALERQKVSAIALASQGFIGIVIPIKNGYAAGLQVGADLRAIGTLTILKKVGDVLRDNRFFILNPQRGTLLRYQLRGPGDGGDFLSKPLFFGDFLLLFGSLLEDLRVVDEFLGINHRVSHSFHWSK